LGCAPARAQPTTHFDPHDNYFDLSQLRASAYALSNLNRGISPNDACGGKQGIKLEKRYYLNVADPYDVGRLSFVSLGYIPPRIWWAAMAQGFDPGRSAACIWPATFRSHGCRPTSTRVSKLPVKAALRPG
jgi:hypothetical protein